jgi:hypothetical protein
MRQTRKEPRQFVLLIDSGSFLRFSPLGCRRYRRQGSVEGCPRLLPLSQGLLFQAKTPWRSPPAIVSTAIVRVCGANNPPVIDGSIIARCVSTVVCRSVAVAVRWGIPTVINRGIATVISRGIAAIVAVPRTAVVTVTWTIGVGAGRYATNHRTSNQSARQAGTPPTPATPPRLSR